MLETSHRLEHTPTKRVGYYICIEELEKELLPSPNPSVRTLSPNCQRHDELLAPDNPSAQVLQPRIDALQALVADLQGVIRDLTLAQPALGQPEEAAGEQAVLGRAGAAVDAFQLAGVAQQRVGHDPVGADVAPRVLDRVGRGLQGDVGAALGADGLVAHLHGGGGVGDAVEHVRQRVFRVQPDVGAARRRVVVEAGRGPEGRA